MSLAAPSSTAFRPKPRISDTVPWSPSPSAAKKPQGASRKQQKEEEEEDEEVLIATEMAKVAAKNPHLSAAELLKLVVVGSNSSQKQGVIEDQVQQPEKEQVQQPEEKPKNWAESLVGWAESVAFTLDTKLEEFQDAYERRIYAEEIEKDKKYRVLSKKVKFLQKALAADRLFGNRVETDHSFKRQREEKNLLHLNDKIGKQLRLFTSAAYNVHVYGKAILRANKKQNIASDNPEELSLEAQLCRNMHQMITIQKQKSKLVQSTKDITNYLEKCKMWLSGKKALFEDHIATYSAMASLYKDIVEKQDELIRRLKESDEFKEVDLESVELNSSWADLNQLEQQEDNKIRLSFGLTATVATMAALKGLPINDAIDKRLAAYEKAKLEPPPPKVRPPSPPDVSALDPRLEQAPLPLKTPEIIIETNNDAGSVSSHLSDPDAEGIDELDPSN